jgi:hypothetical protein
MPTISQLPAAASVLSTDLFAIVQNNVTLKATQSQVIANIASTIVITESQVTNLVSDLAARLIATNNLSDLTSIVNARTNLGLGSIALLNAPVDVPNGGTGNMSMSPYAVICGGASSTDVLQSVAAGTIGQVLTYTGAGSLPTWQAAGGGGGGTVTSGTINQLTYYAATGNTVSGLPTVSDRIMVSVGGVPTWTLSLPTGSTIGGYVKADGSVPMTGELLLVNSTPSTALAAASKGYVDSVATGFNVVPSVAAGTVSALTATYNNGAAGVGATLTNSGAQAAFSVDGYSPSVNSRVLVNNQVSQFQNGIYTLTTVGSGVSNWVLTRATDYDQPSEIHPGDVVVINNGTTLKGSSWVQGDSVTTIGTDPISFGQISPSLPVSLANGGTGASLTPVNGGILYGTASTSALSAVGSSGQILRSGGAGAPTWSAATYPSAAGSAANVLTSDGTNWVSSTPSAASPLTTKGDLYSFTTVNARLAVGANDGQMLQVDSAASTGLAWSTATYPMTTTAHQILYSSANNVVSGITSANSSILVTDGAGAPFWATTIPAFTTSSITFSPTSGGIVGTTTNDNAAAGKVGEYIVSNILSGSAIAFSSNVQKTLTNISLTAGDWDVEGTLIPVNSGATINSVAAGISFVNNVFATPSDTSAYNGFSGLNMVLNGTFLMNTGVCRISLAAPATVYIIGNILYSGGAITCWGWIRARRVR